MGRKTMILIFLVIKIVGCVLSTLAGTFVVYAGSRLILGIGNSGVYMGAFVLRKQCLVRYCACVILDLLPTM